MSNYKWIRFGTPADNITGGDAPADLPTLEDVPSTFDDVILRDFSTKAHSVLAKEPFWQKFFEVITIEFQRLVHHALFLKHVFDYNTYLGEESEFDARIQNIYVTLGFPFSTSFGDFINADDPDFKTPDITKEKEFFNKKIFWKQFSIENIVFLRKWLGSLYGYRQIFSSIFRRGSVFLTFKYEVNIFSEISGHKFRLFDFTSFDRILPPTEGGSITSTWPDVTTIDGIIDYSFVTQVPYQFDSKYTFDGTFDPGVPGTEAGTLITWDSGITASNSNKGLALEITCDRLLYHYNTLYNPSDNNPVLYCLMDLPWVDYILNLSRTIQRATDKVKVGSQLSLIGDLSNTITPYTGSGSDIRLYYTHPNVRAKFQIIKTKYATGIFPVLVRVGTGVYKDWDTGSDPDEFFLRRDQLFADEPPGAWEAIWGVNTANFIDYGDCESLNPPIIEGETTPLIQSADWNRNSEYAQSGSYSYRMIKNTILNTATVYIVDSQSSTDLHGILPGRTYTLGMWVYSPNLLPSSTVFIRMSYYESSWVTSFHTQSFLAGTWTYVQVSRSIPLTATGFYMSIEIASGASQGTYINIDNIVLTRTGDTTINNIKNPVFEMSIGQYERHQIGIWEFNHAMLSAAMFKEELMTSVTIRMNKYPAYFYLTVTNFCTSNGNITILLGTSSYPIALNTIDHDTISKVAEKIRQTIFEKWDVRGSGTLVLFFPRIVGDYNDPNSVFTDTDSTGVSATCTGIPEIETTTINLPHTYIAPGSVELRIEFGESSFNTIPGNDFPVPDEVTHTLIIKEIRRNNQWEVISYIKSNYRKYLNNSAETIIDYYNGYRDIIENDNVYYDSSAIDENGNFLPSYFKVQETIAFNLQEISINTEITIDHNTGEIVVAPEIIRNAFQIYKDSNLEYDGSGDRYINIDTNIYATYNIRANETLRRTAIIGITEVGLFNETGNMIAYGAFPPIIYDSLKHHASFNFFIAAKILDSIPI